MKSAHWWMSICRPSIPSCFFQRGEMRENLVLSLANAMEETVQLYSSRTEPFKDRLVRHLFHHENSMSDQLVGWCWWIPVSGDIGAFESFSPVYVVSGKLGVDLGTHKLYHSCITRWSELFRGADSCPRHRWMCFVVSWVTSIIVIL